VVVKVKQGQLQGVEAGGIRYFRSVPYAQPPVGALRFKAPLPAKPWTGTRMADKNSPAAIQVRSQLGTNQAAEDTPTSEDCLYLSVWAPSEAGPHPIYAYIHGGGNVGGYSLEHRIDGATFARDGIVCVSIEYRLGVLGFLELDGLLGEDYGGSGNNGILDQLLALKWIRENIAAFGGNPDQVTIGGQSAGGINVCTLVASPLAKGLFRGAISESGGGSNALDLEQAKENAQRYAAAFKKLGGNVQEVANAPVDLILRAQQESHIQSWPVVDGKVLTDIPFVAARKGAGADVALLIGTNREEMGGAPKMPEEMKAFSRFKELHPGLNDEQLKRQFGAERQFGAPSWIFADSHSSSGGATYVYLFTWSGLTGPNAGLAIHGLEVSLVWDHAAALASRYVVPEPYIQALVADMHGLWSSFIKTGTPANPNVPAWPRWTERDRRFMEIDTTFRVSSLNSAELALWDGVVKGA
jgi:para-nitrobenzyl esterase